MLLVLTEWDEFLRIDPRMMGEAVRRRVVIDGRMCLDKSKWQDAGWQYWT